MAGINRVEANGEVLLDLTEDTVTPSSLRTGFTAHDRNGDIITGVGDSIGAIDDSAGIGDTDKVWSADKSATEVNKLAPKASPTFTGTPTAPTATAATNTTQIATTEFVHDAIANDVAGDLIDDTAISGIRNKTWSAHKLSGLAPKASPSFTGTPTAPAMDLESSDTEWDQIVNFTTLFEYTDRYARKNSPTFTGIPLAPTPAAGTNNNQIATTNFVKAGLDLKSDSNSPVFTGTPTAPTATVGTSTTQIATTEFVNDSIENTIDDTAGVGDTDKVWSADKSATEFNDLNAEIYKKADVIIKSIEGPSFFCKDSSENSITSLLINIPVNQIGSGTPSPSNYRDISPYSDCTLFTAGKNLFSRDSFPSDITINGVTLYSYSGNELHIEGQATDDTIFQSYPFCLPAGTYAFSGCITKLNHIEVINASHAPGEIIGSDYGNGCVFTISEKSNVFIKIYLTSGTEINNDVFPQIENNFYVTEFEQSLANSYFIDFNDITGGNIYTCNINLYTGLLTIPMIGETFTQCISYDASRNIARISENAKSWGNAYYSYLRTVSTNAPGLNQGSKGTSSGRLLIHLPDTVTSKEQCDEYLTAHPLEVVYEIREPLTYHIDPILFNSYFGNNAIYSDFGNVSVTYCADTKLYIDQKIEESQRATRSLISGIEIAMKATKNYNIGDLLIVGDSLYKVTANISNGGNITVGTNVIATTVAEQLILLAQA